VSHPHVPPTDEPAVESVKVTDRRRIDPVTGAVRHPPAPARPAEPAQPPGPVPADQPGGPDDVLGAELGQTERQVAEVTADLQRVHAEYANYRKRVERDRELVRSQSAAAVLAELLPALDDIGRAREHGELEGAFKSVGEELEAAVQRTGLERFGAVGDRFDPLVHEALTHEHRADVTEPVCVAVYQPGYSFAGRVLRPARVGVAEPGEE
jgi:molecular chaperone GrpE